MTQQVDERARRAGAAVQARTAQVDADRGLVDVVRRGRRPRPVIVLAVLLALALAVPGLGWLGGLSDARLELQSPAEEPETPAPPDPDPDGGTSPAPAGPEGSEPESRPEPTGPAPVGPYGTDPVTDGDFPIGGGEYALLTDVRVGGHEGFDRVVLELDGPDMPSYRVAYVDPPIVQDGSGDEMTVEGGAFLELRLTPASGVDAVGTEWVPVYEGPFRVTGDTALVTEVVRTGDFEANLAWVVGLREQRPFAVTVLSDPLRLVVDIASD